jgi:hypothetical protein
MTAALVPLLLLHHSCTAAVVIAVQMLQAQDAAGFSG